MLDAPYGNSGTSHLRSDREEESDAFLELFDWGGVAGANTIPCDHDYFPEYDAHKPEIACLLSTNGDDQSFIHWNGPSLLSPITTAGDVFRYVSAIVPQKTIDWLEIQFSVTHKYTGEIVTLLPFFLPRCESALGNLRRCREQTVDSMRKFTRSKSAADFWFHIFAWPRNDDRFIQWHPGEPLQAADYPRPERVLDPEWFIRNLSSYF